MGSLGYMNVVMALHFIVLAGSQRGVVRVLVNSFLF